MSRIGAEFYGQVPEGADLGYILESLRTLTVPVVALRSDPHNAMTHPTRNLDAVTESLRRYGQRKPIVANLPAVGAPVIEAGNGTLEAARKLGWLYVAVVFVRDDDRTAKGYAIADNRTAQLAEWDEERLAEWAKGDEETARAIGFDDDDMAALSGDDGELPIEEWDMTPTRDRFCLTISGTLPLEAEVRARLKDLPGEVEIEVSTIPG